MPLHSIFLIAECRFPIVGTQAAVAFLDNEKLSQTQKSKFKNQKSKLGSL